MDLKELDFVPTPKLVTLRKLDACESYLRKAMKHYNTTVASSIFIKAMMDAPSLSEDLDDLRRKYRKLLKDHDELKQEMKDYFYSEQKIKELINMK